MPVELRDRHRSATGANSALLARLREHSAPVIEAARTEIGGVHIPRPALLDELLCLLEEYQIVLVVGEAGSGKSALAREAFDVLSSDSLGMAFPAESFATAHIDHTFGPIGLDLTRIKDLCALHDRKIAWIESLERLLEKTTRDAFTDFISAVKRDLSWRLVITCRDYSDLSLTLRFSKVSALNVTSSKCRSSRPLSGNSVRSDSIRRRWKTFAASSGKTRVRVFQHAAKEYRPKEEPDPNINRFSFCMP